MTTIHELKIWPEFYHAVLSGEKTFELRKNDRDFHVGDVLHLKEFIPCKLCQGGGRVWDSGDRINCCKAPHGEYSGLYLFVEVTYILDDERFGLKEGYIVMGIRQAESSDD